MLVGTIVIISLSLSLSLQQCVTDGEAFQAGGSSV